MEGSDDLGTGQVEATGGQDASPAVANGGQRALSTGGSLFLC
jgi:hypothetical protein